MAWDEEEDGDWDEFINGPDSSSDLEDFAAGIDTDSVMSDEELVLQKGLSKLYRPAKQDDLSHDDDFELGIEMEIIRESDPYAGLGTLYYMFRELQKKLQSKSVTKIKITDAMYPPIRALQSKHPSKLSDAARYYRGVGSSVKRGIDVKATDEFIRLEIARLAGKAPDSDERHLEAYLTERSTKQPGMRIIQILTPDNEAPVYESAVEDPTSPIPSKGSSIVYRGKTRNVRFARVEVEQFRTSSDVFYRIIVRVVTS